MSCELRVLHDDINSRVRSFGDRYWPCRKGCDHCCRSLHRQPVITQAEWLLLEPVLTDELVERIHHSSGKTCPLLNQQSGTCEVYDVRPVACRTYGYYADREGGWYCSQIERMDNENVIWGNGEAVEQRLDLLGPRHSLPEWLIRSGKLR